MAQQANILLEGVLPPLAQLEEEYEKQNKSITSE